MPSYLIMWTKSGWFIIVRTYTPSYKCHRSARFLVNAEALGNYPRGETPICLRTLTRSMSSVFKLGLIVTGFRSVSADATLGLKATYK